MKTWDYEVLGENGKRQRGRVEADSEQAAQQELTRQGAVLLTIAEGGLGLKREIQLPGLGNRVPTKSLAIFARQFATMTASGLSLLRSLAVLEEQSAVAPLTKAIAAVRSDIEGGQSLSSAMAARPKIFPTLMVAMIRAGETGGFLDEALDRVAINLEKEVALRGKIKGALTYPTIVLTFAGLMILGVLAFIVPIFQKLFAQLGSQLPLPTRVLVTVSHQLFWLLPASVGAIVLAVTLVRRALRTSPRFRLAFDGRKLHLPVVGSLYTKLAVSRFSRNLGTLLAVGVPILKALDVVAETTGSAVIADAMTDVAAGVRDGEPISARLAHHSIFPAMVIQMVEVGEESGQISAMLDKVADFYDREVDSAAEALTASIEPLMVVVMGAVIGAMVVCLYLPMFSIYGHIQGASS